MSGDDRKYRSIVATINFVATDVLGLHFACNEACREMSAPTVQPWKKVKRIGRYLFGREKVVWMFLSGDGHGSLKVFPDSDWAGDLETRKLTSGGILTIGEQCLKTWSTNQSSFALSSCEAESYAVVGGALRALEMQTQRQNFEVGDLSVEMATDSSGAKSCASRRGSGRTRLIEVVWLWLQQAVADGRFRMTKVKWWLTSAVEVVISVAMRRLENL